MGAKKSKALLPQTEDEPLTGWSAYLDVFKRLPELILNEYHFLPGTPDETLLVQQSRESYSTLAQWLDYLVPGDKPQDPDLFFTHKISFKAQAIGCKVFLDLMIELLPRCGDLQRYFSTPADLWLTWEAELLQAAFLKTGLITGAPDYDNLNKAQLEGFTGKTDRLMQQVDGLKLSPVGGAQTCSASELIIFWIARVAADDFTFRNSEALRQYKRVTTANCRNIRRNKDSQPFLLKDGKKQATGRKKQRQSAKPKGFVTET